MHGLLFFSTSLISVNNICIVNNTQNDAHDVQFKKVACNYNINVNI